MAEADQIKWIGIRPVSPVENIQVHPGIFETTVAGVTRTQVVKSVEVNNTTTIIHTVTAGKIFYLCSCFLSADSGAGEYSHLCVRNDSDVFQYHIIGFTTGAATPSNNSLTFFPPIAIPAGWDIFCITDSGHADSFIHGWEQ